MRTRRAHAYRSRRAALICQTSHERHAFGPQLWTSCPAGTRKAEGSAALPSRVQWHCPRAPTLEPDKGRRPKDRQSQRRNVFLPGCSVFSLSWPACGGAFLVPGRWFSGPAPSGSCLAFVLFLFLSFGRGRHVPAPSGRDVGSNSGAPTQEPVFSGISLHLVLFNLLFANSAASVLIGEVSEAVYECGRGGERSR